MIPNTASTTVGIGETKEVTINEHGCVGFWATTGEYNVDNLLTGLERVMEGEGGPPRIKTDGVVVKNSHAITIKSTVGPWSVVLIPLYGGRRVRVYSSIGRNSYNTKKLHKALLALKRARKGLE